MDLEASCLTNALPVHRLALEVRQAADAPAAYVRVLDLSVERLEHHYTRLGDRDGAQRYHYQASAFESQCDLSYDRAGLGSPIRASGNVSPRGSENAAWSPPQP